MLKAIAFDFDGVIVDSEPLHYRAFIEVVKPLGVVFSYEQYLERYIGYDDRDLFRAIFAELDDPLSADRLRELIGAKAEAFARIVDQGVTAYPGAVELIRRAADAMPIAIVSGALRDDIDLILSGIGDGKLIERFASVVTADRVAASKPDPASYRMAVDELQVEANNCLAIEDTVAGIASAKTAGLRTLGVGQTHPIEQLTSAERTVASLAEVDLPGLRRWFD